MKIIANVFKGIGSAIGIFICFYLIVAFINWDIKIHEIWYYDFWLVFRWVIIAGICIGILLNLKIDFDDDDGPQMG